MDPYGQYSEDRPKVTLSDYSWTAPGKLPLAQPRSFDFWHQGGGVPGGGGSGAGEGPSAPVHVRHEHNYYPEYGSGRDFNDEEAPPIGGSSGGSPVTGPVTGPYRPNGNPSMNGHGSGPGAGVAEAAEEEVPVAVRAASVLV